MQQHKNHKVVNNNTTATTTITQINTKTIYNNTPVLLYVPNIIGYMRIMCLFFSFFLYESYPAFSTFVYLFNTFLDYLDGIAARRLNQCSKFGALFDIIVDNLGAIVLTFKLSEYAPEYMICILLLGQLIETAGNWVITFNSFYVNQYHKGTVYEYQILNIYYNNKYHFLDILVITNESFYSLYMYKLIMKSDNVFLSFLVFVSFVGAMVKNYVGLIKYLNGTKVTQTFEQK